MIITNTKVYESALNDKIKGIPQWDISGEGAVFMGVLDLFNGKADRVRFISCDQPGEDQPPTIVPDKVRFDFTITLGKDSPSEFDPALVAAFIARSLKGQKSVFRMAIADNNGKDVRVSDIVEALVNNASAREIVDAVDALLCRSAGTIRIDVSKVRRDVSDPCGLIASASFCLDADGAVRQCNPDGSLSGQDIYPLSDIPAFKTLLDASRQTASFGNPADFTRCLMAAVIACRMPDGFVMYNVHDSNPALMESCR